MINKIFVVAHLELFAGKNMRKYEFKSGYRPAFEFKGAKSLQSGSITLLDRESLHPGNSAIVQITFLQGIIEDAFFKKGNIFTFREGEYVLGKGEIINISLNQA